MHSDPDLKNHSRELFITTGTVKRHTNHIYGKLGVHSRTAADDDTAPQVLWTSPDDGETIAQPAATSIITVTVEPVYPPSLLVKFSEPLDPATVTAANIQVEEERGGNITVTPVYDEWSNWLNIVIREPCQAVEYTVTLSSGLKDTSGNSLAADYAWSFSVALVASDKNIYILFVAK